MDPPPPPVAARALKKGEKKIPVGTTPAEVESLLHLVAEHVARNPTAFKTDRLRTIPAEVWNEMLSYLMHKKLITEENLRLILKNTSFVSFELAKNYQSVSASALSQIALADTLLSLSLAGALKLNDETLRVIIRGCSRLKMLDLSSCTQITREGAEFADTHLPQLHSLALDRCSDLNGDITFRGKGLTSLRMAGGNSRKAISLIFETPSLHTLDLRDNVALHSLSWSPPSFRSSSLSVLNVAACKSLQRDSLAKFLRSTENLKQLTLFECGDAAAELFQPDTTERLKNLEKLVLHGCKVTDRDVESIGKFCINLQILFLNRCARVTDVGFPHLANCTQLRLLAIPPSVSNKPIVSVLSKCTSLETFDAGENLIISATVIHAVLRNCTQLFALNLSGCKFLNGAAFEILRDMKGTLTLQNLNLRGVDDIGDDTLLVLSQRCARLSAVDLYRNSQISDWGVGTLVKACGKSLKRLTISGCAMLTDQALFHIAEFCDVIQFLEVFGIPGVTPEGIQKVISSCRNLLELNVSSNFLLDAQRFASLSKSRARIFASATA